MGRSMDICRLPNASGNTPALKLSRDVFSPVFSLFPCALHVLRPAPSINSIKISNPLNHDLQLLLTILQCTRTLQMEMFRLKNIVITAAQLFIHATRTTRTITISTPISTLSPINVNVNILKHIIYSTGFFVFRLSLLFRFGNTAADDIILDFLFLVPLPALFAMLTRA